MFSFNVDALTNIFESETFAVAADTFVWRD